MLLQSLANTASIAPIFEQHVNGTGYTPKMLMAGFNAMFSHWNDKELSSFILNEIPGFSPNHIDDFLNIDLDISQRKALLNHTCSQKLFLITASTVPSAAFQDILLTLLLPIHIVHRPSHTQADFFHAIHAWLMQHAPQMAERWELMEPTYDDQILSDCMASCDAVNISASQKTIEHFRILRDALPQTMKPLKWIEHGHKISAIVLFEDDIQTLTETDYKAIAWDASIWDQTGCLSPKCIYMTCSHEDARSFAQKLLSALDQVANELPEIQPSIAALVMRNSALLMAQLKGAAILTGNKNHDCIVIHTDIADPILLPRMLNLYPIQNIEQIHMHLAPYGQTLASKKMLTPEEKNLFSKAGFNVFSKLGQMQNPPLTWFHDNVGTLRPYFN